MTRRSVIVALSIVTAAVIGFTLPTPSLAAPTVNRQLCEHLYHRATHTTGRIHDRVMIRGTLAGCFILH